jgi:predicted GNAT family acetyltransferase
MGMNLDDIRLPRPTIDLATPDWDSYVRIIGLAPDYLRHADRDAYHVLIARCGLESVSTAMAFDCGDDCGIFNVGTLDGYRRRGFGTALTVTQLYDARARGCRTASLQSTLMAERIYAAVGFRDHGRFLEYVPTS